MELDPNEPVPDDFEQDSDSEIDKLLSLVRSKSTLDAPQSEEFYSTTMQILERMKITFAGISSLKSNLEERIAASTFLGQNELWSSQNLYRQLLLLEGHVSQTRHSSCRAWIEAFFFRASAMLPPEKHMALISATTINQASSSTLSGLVDYVAVVTDHDTACIILEDTDLHNLGMYMLSAFFVIETNLSIPSDDVPQAVCRMYACGKLLQEKVVRGAVTNGHDWIFILLKLTDNFDGGSYKRSRVLRLNITESLDGVLEIRRTWPDLIAAILSHWVENGFSDLGSDDWYEA